MEKIIYSLVRNLLVTKYSFADKFQNTSDVVSFVENWKGLNNEPRTDEYIFQYWRGNVTFTSTLKDIPLQVTDAERRENKPNDVALRYFKTLEAFLKD